MLTCRGKELYTIESGSLPMEDRLPMTEQELLCWITLVQISGRGLTAMRDRNTLCRAEQANCALACPLVPLG